MDNREAIGQVIVFIENLLCEPIAACDAAKAVSCSCHHSYKKQALQLKSRSKACFLWFTDFSAVSGRLR